MNTFSQSTNANKINIKWYKVPIMWLMLALLSSTVISGIYLFILAHDTQDRVVIEKEHTPLSKKLAFPENNHSSKLNSD